MRLGWYSPAGSVSMWAGIHIQKAGMTRPAGLTAGRAIDPDTLDDDFEEA